jgi:hypothetical protein
MVKSSDRSIKLVDKIRNLVGSMFSPKKKEKEDKVITIWENNKAIGRFIVIRS